MKNVTIQDIAREAKVSKSTVSRVLNDTSAVNPVKRRAVLEATERLGFKPNVLAQSLAKGRSMTIGVLTQNIGSPFYDAISQGLIAGLSGTGYSPIFVDGQWREAEEVEAIRALLGRRVDGLILIGGDVPGVELEELCGRVPTVSVARKLSEGKWPCVFTDNVEGGYRATKYLIGRGHREIAIICGIKQHPDATDRYEGYRKALEEAGIGLDLGLVLEGDFTADAGVAGIEKLLEGGKRFTAVFAANDMTAFGARLALFRRGVRVPEDVSLVGFDDQLESAYMAPPLTTVRQPARRMGGEAVRALMGLIEGGEFESSSFSGELKERESVAALG
ncbi:MAG: LacI family DNA-binding transcriptional regulator [Verrucomicrobiales bacterium]|nr:LacI family DNA-binding transcriptional regulator [Verrucomicrobiales bacterium]